jgi:AcrR family transcriptional regulator
MSYKGVVVVNGVNYGHRLPRGRHGIPRELVTANQRERLLRATTEIFAEEGYASLAVRNVIARAGVSRATFYRIFDGKVDLVRAAQKRAFEELEGDATAACSASKDWPEGVAAGIGSVLDFARESRAECRLLLASGPLSEPDLARQGLEVQQGLVDLLRRGSERYPSARSPRELTVRAAVGAAIWLVGNCAAADELDAVSDLKPDLVQIILTPFIGANEAKRIGNSASGSRGDDAS